MVDSGTGSHRRGNGAITIALSAALLVAVGSCNPIESYRNWIGISANDPNPQTTPNTKNLAAGEARSYPNLATVPPPPDQALTTAELNKLAQNLIGGRANAKYTSEHLQAQSDEAAVPPPPSLPPPPTGGPTPGGSHPVAPVPTSPGTGPGATAPPAAAVSANTPAGVPGGGTSAKVASGAAGRRKPGQPPEPGPMESSLQSPQIASLPQPQQSQPAPPPPRELSLPAASAAANPAAAGAHLPAPPAPEPMPAALGSAKFQPAPPPPQLASTAPVRTATAAPAGKPPKPAPPPIAFAKVTDISFSGDETTLSDAGRKAVAQMLARYRAKPGLVRVVGYAGIGSGAAAQLNAYRVALDRAQAVAKELAKEGIPANKIAAEAAPTGSDTGPGRAAVLFEQ